MNLKRTHLVAFLRILEVVNTIPGETFIQSHLWALIEHTDLDISWAAVQQKPIDQTFARTSGLKEAFHLTNYYALPKWKKGIHYIKGKFAQDSNWRSKLLLKDIQKAKPDLIHFQFAALAGRFHWAATELNIPYTFSVRGSDVNVFPWVIDGYQENLKEAIKHAAGIQVVSEYMETQTRQFNDHHNIKVIRTLVDPAWNTSNHEPKQAHFIAVGRLHWIKGYDDLILAFAEVLKKHPESTLSIVGDGDKKTQLSYMIRDLKLDQSVRLLGRIPQSEIRTHLSQASALVLTSLMEGFPNVIAEAMMAEVPVISTKVGGVEELLKHGEQALLVPPAQPQALAEAMLQNIDAPREAQQMAERAKQVALKHFSPKTHATTFKEWWAHL